MLKKIMAPPFSAIKIVKYCGVGGGEHWGRQNPKNIMAPPSLSLRLLSIVASGEGGGHWGGAKFYKR